MVRLLDVKMMAELIHTHGIESIFTDIMARLKTDFSNWEKFDKMPRPAFHVDGGVIELMPVCNDERFSFKYVNGHPKNPNSGKQTVVATGQLSNVNDGYPIMISEMTLLTALRTAGTSALASDLLAKKDSSTIAIIGTGAQSEYQTIAHKLIRDIKEVRYFDIDAKAMDKYETNMQSNFAGSKVDLIRCDDAQSAVKGADIIIVCTADKQNATVLKNEWLESGQHINALGGDCPGKTELEETIVQNNKTVVEFFDQSFIEGEIQKFDEATARSIVDAEFYEVINGKAIRTSDDDITVFDGVGIALEDFSALNVVYELAEKYNIGKNYEMVPDITDPKNLFGVLVD
ncbi:MAG: ornithine cyclodeaminase [Alphaproteobacteria bacterium]